MNRANLRRRLAHIEALVATAQPLPLAAPAWAPAPDAEELAREAGAAFVGRFDLYHKRLGLSREEALQRADEPAPFLEEAARAGPPEAVTWGMLEGVAARDPAAALQAWERVKAAARKELDSGHRAARAIGGCGDAWARAQFLAVRAALSEAWQPRDAVEQQLVDQLAQWQTLLEDWLRALVNWTSLTADARDQEGCPTLPRLTETEALERAVGKVEALHRLYMRTLKALQELRRRAPAVVVRRAGQVNIGQQQVNVGTS
jgi:hypothetical protein